MAHLAVNAALSLEHVLCSKCSWKIRISRPPYTPFCILTPKCVSRSCFLVDHLGFWFSTITIQFSQLVSLLSSIPLLLTIGSLDQNEVSPRAERQAAAPPRLQRHWEWTVHGSSCCDSPAAPFNFRLQAQELARRTQTATYHTEVEVTVIVGILRAMRYRVSHFVAQTSAKHSRFWLTPFPCRAKLPYRFATTSLENVSQELCRRWPTTNQFVWHLIRKNR